MTTVHFSADVDKPLVPLLSALLHDKPTTKAVRCRLRAHPWLLLVSATVETETVWSNDAVRHIAAWSGEVRKADSFAECFYKKVEVSEPLSHAIEVLHSSPGVATVRFIDTDVRINNRRILCFPYESAVTTLTTMSFDIKKA